MSDDIGPISKAFVAIALIALALIALWGTWNIASQHSLNRQTSEHYTRESAEETQQEIRETCINALGGVDFVCVDKKIDAYRSSEDANEDLTAQKQMALWAGAMFWATIWTSIVAGAGIYYVRQTLMETRRIGQAQTRAYLSCESVTVRVDSGCVWFYPTLKNNGQSPAESTRFSAYMDIAGPGIRNGKSKDSEGDGPYVAAGQIGMAYIPWSRDEIPKDAFLGLRNRSVTFEIFCRLYCTDVFGIERKTTFLVSVGKQLGASNDDAVIYSGGDIDHLPPGVYDD